MNEALNLLSFSWPPGKGRHPDAHGVFFFPLATEGRSAMFFLLLRCFFFSLYLEGFLLFFILGSNRLGHHVFFLVFSKMVNRSSQARLALATLPFPLLFAIGLPPSTALQRIMALA